MRGRPATAMHGSHGALSHGSHGHTEAAAKHHFPRSNSINSSFRVAQDALAAGVSRASTLRGTHSSNGAAHNDSPSMARACNALEPAHVKVVLTTSGHNLAVLCRQPAQIPFVHAGGLDGDAPRFTLDFPCSSCYNGTVHSDPVLLGVTAIRRETGHSAPRPVTPTSSFYRHLLPVPCPRISHSLRFLAARCSLAKSSAYL